MLSHLVEDVSTPDESLSGQIHSIDQQKIAGDDAKTLASEGFVYVPKSCAQGEPCRAHISFHGCNQYADAVGDAYTTQTGLNEWADDNNIVVLYPQTKKSLFMPLNPQGCWLVGLYLWRLRQQERRTNKRSKTAAVFIK